MRSVKLTIAGSFWDSQIYSGELILFDFDGAIHRIEWREVIDSLATSNEAEQTAIRVAFSDSDLFYNHKVRKILFDPQIESPIKKQLASLAERSIVTTRSELKSQWRTENTPFPFLPVDTDVYYNRIFAGGDEGLFSAARTGGATSRLFGNQASKHHDGRVFQVRASDNYTAIAAATGDDGLFEFAFNRNDDNVLREPTRLATRPCSACDWAFQSVMGWTAQDAFLASFRNETDSAGGRVLRSFDRIVNVKEMFGDEDNSVGSVGFTWGCREKIYRVSESGVEVANYSHSVSKKQKKEVAKEKMQLFTSRGSVNLNFDATDAIATGTAPFGTVLEFDDRLVVLRSDGEVEVFDGEPVHWRVFPRSDHYSNQLHILYDDKAEIVSFVHDYFVDQSTKLSGFSRGSNDFAF
jgi:hypothetical protein